MGRDTRVAHELFDFVSKPARAGRVRGYLIADTGRLFHPKAHASRSGSRTRVVVGSANLTEGGFADNHEMVGVIDDDLGVYDQFIAAVNALSQEADAIAVNEETRQRVVRWIERRPIVPVSTSAGALGPPAERAQLFLPSLDDDALPPAVTRPLIDAPVMPGAALGAVARLLDLGCRLQYVNAPDDLTVPVSLRAFKSAGIIADSASKSLGPALRVARHSTMAVGLVSPDLRKQLKDLNNSLGQLKGRFVLETAGLAWMPASWNSAFSRLWEEVVKKHGFDPARTKEDVVSHLKVLGHDLHHANAPLLQDLRDAVDLQPKARWRDAAARRLLGENADEGTALRAILDHVRTTVQSRLQEAWVLAQFENIHEAPRLRRPAFDRPDPLEALHALSDWTLAAVAPQARVDAGEAHGPSNGVAHALYKRLDTQAGELIEIYRTATGWRRRVSSPPEDAAVLLDEAWAHFSHWFRLDDERLEQWPGLPPGSSSNRSDDKWF
jgi:hypothetical protein